MGVKKEIVQNLRKPSHIIVKKIQTIVDLLPRTPYNQQTVNCYKGWVLSPCAQDFINVVATLHVVLKYCNRICWILCPWFEFITFEKTCTLLTLRRFGITCTIVQLVLQKHGMLSLNFKQSPSLVAYPPTLSHIISFFAHLFHNNHLCVDVG